MNIEKFYSGIIEEIFRKKDDKKFIATGLTCNIDAVFPISELSLNDTSECTEKQPGTISDTEDLKKLIAFHALKECGAEYIYNIPEIYEWLISNHKHELKLGGTGAQAANAISAIGRKVIFHCPELNEEVVSLLTNNNIFIPKETLVLPEKAINGKDSFKHYIVEVNKNTKLKFTDKILNCRRENRIMIRPVEWLNIEDQYFDYLLKHNSEISSILISGFNATNNYKELDESLSIIKEKVALLKEQNSEIQFYVEGGDSNIKGFKEKIFWGISEFSDIIGMNENEFEYLAETEGIKINYSEIDSLLDAIKQILIKMVKVKTFIVHTRDYSIGLTKADNIKQIRDSIASGNLFATCRAATGRFSSYKELVDITKNIEVSKSGTEIAKQVFSNNGDDSFLCGKLSNDINFTLVPTKTIDIPVCTVGLGDSFVAGFLTLN